MAPHDLLLFFAVTTRLVAYLFLVDLLTALVQGERHAVVLYAIGMALAFIISSMLATVLCLQSDTCRCLYPQTGRTSVFTALRRSATVPAMEIKDEDLDAFFDEHFAALTDMAVGQFKLSEEDAEDVANEILVATLFNLPRIDDIKPWLAGALAYAVQNKQVEA